MSDVASYSDEAWARLGDAIRRGRVALRKTQDQLAADAGVSVNTIRNLERGHRARHLTLPRINDALGWTPDSYINVLENLADPQMADAVEPKPVDDSLHLERPESLAEDEWAELKAQLVGTYDWYTRRRSN